MPLKFVSKQKIFIAQYREDKNFKNVCIKHTIGRDIEKLNGFVRGMIRNTITINVFKRGMESFYASLK